MVDSEPTFAGKPRCSEEVLHVVSAAVLARWGPMLRKTLWALGESGVAIAVLSDDRDLLASLPEMMEGRHVEHLGGWRAWPVGGILAHWSPPPGLVHVWGTAGLGWIEHWATHAGVPVVVHALSLADVERLAHRAPGARRHVVTIAPGLVARGPRGWPTENWTVIPPAAALPFNWTPTGVGGRVPGVLCVEAMEQPAEAGVLVDAVAQLRREGRELQAVIIGAGAGQSAVWRHIRAAGVQDCCVIVDEPRLWEKGLPGADICVVPGCERIPSLAPLLAMGLGKLVIAAREQLGDWFIEERTAWQFTPGSGVELAYLLARAIEQPEQAQQTATSAAEYFEEHHAVGAFVERLIDLYCAVLAQATSVHRGAEGSAAP
jgi:hypothetical protein